MSEAEKKRITSLTGYYTPGQFAHGSIEQAIRKMIPYIEKGWTTLYFARNTNNRPVRPMSPDAVCWCLKGAYIKSTYGHRDDVYQFLIKQIPKLIHFKHVCPLAEFNDRKGRTKARILKFLNDAANKAAQQGI